MPVDQKRINGPEITIPYNIYVDLKNTNKKRDKQHRKDGRANDEARKMYVKTGVISQAKGSAYIEMGNTKVVCSVFDPREIPNRSEYCVQGELFCEFKFAPFSCSKRKIHQQDSEEKKYSLILQRALEPAVCLNEFPNFQVDVYAVVLDNAGSSLAAAIMAASLALASAGVPMFGLVTATTMGISQGRFLVDPTDVEESLCNESQCPTEASTDYGITVQAALPQHGQITEFYLVGSMSTTTIESALEQSMTANKNICQVLQQCLVKSVMNSFRKK